MGIKISQIIAREFKLLAMEMQLGREVPYSFRRLGQHRGIRGDHDGVNIAESGETIESIISPTRM